MTDPVISVDPSPETDPASSGGSVLSSGSASRPSRRRSSWIAASVAVLLVLVAGAVVYAERTGGRRVTYEVSTVSGTALMAVYTDEGAKFQTGVYRADRMYETVPTPWSTTVTFKASTGELRMAVDVADKNDVATCRIKAGGRVIAQSTTAGGAMCASTLEVAFPR